MWCVVLLLLLYWRDNFEILFEPGTHLTGLLNNKELCNVRRCSSSSLSIVHCIHNNYSWCADGWVRWRGGTLISSHYQHIISTLVNTKHRVTHICYVLTGHSPAIARPSSEANIEYNGSIFKSLDIFCRFIVRRWYFRLRLVLVYLLQTVTELDHQGWTNSDAPNLNNCLSWACCTKIPSQGKYKNCHPSFLN